MTSKHQVASEGYVLKNGDLYSREVFLPEEAEYWEVVSDEGQLDPNQSENPIEE